MMVLTIPQSVKAYDFSAVCSTGQTLYYNYLSSSSVTVTYPGSGVSPYGGYSKPTGGLAIPSSVMHNGITYSVTYIGAIAFKGCSGLTSVTIPNSVTYIGDHAFKGCSGLTWVIIGNSVTSIGNHAFYDCSGLTLVTIPNSVTSIGNYAFYNCSGLTWVNIGDSVTSIGNYAFYNCSGLTSVTVESGNTVYDSRGNCNAIIETSTNTLIAGCMNTVIPNSVTSIGDAAFYNCSGLTLVTIPNSVTSIGVPKLLRIDINNHPQFHHIHWRSGVRWLQRPDLGDHPQLRHLDWRLCVLLLQWPHLGAIQRRKLR